MIFALIGAHGAGKSTLVREHVARYSSITLVYEGWTRQPTRMICAAPPRREVEVIGYYADNAMSGPDSGRFAGHIPEVYTWIEAAHQSGHHALVEGTIILGSLRRLFGLHRAGVPVTLAYLDLPLAECEAAVVLRKASRHHKHSMRPVNTALIRAKAAACEQAVRAVRAAGIPVLQGGRVGLGAAIQTALAVV